MRRLLDIDVLQVGVFLIHQAAVTIDVSPDQPKSAGLVRPSDKARLLGQPDCFLSDGLTIEGQAVRRRWLEGLNTLHYRFRAFPALTEAFGGGVFRAP